ncbi:DNA-binding protein HU-beta [Thermomonospora echinospora]|uniref:DNA-binding protein HU-beta n=1 Tax=Thermomonospora echinospora TaxID=1992 RepID=A0A1H5ZXA8_9ACTN|nr:HU family DNA-binding protein [Thermomonospora echinospora]SEG41089.1 DNA-binding protein HU-beta [Thermomonospora echinospora]
MNRTELIEAVAARAGSDPAVARRHVDAVFETIMDRVADGERVLVTGFGTFDRVSRPARTARNPRTGLPVEVAATEAPRFRVGQTFRDRVAGSVAVLEAVAEPEPEVRPGPVAVVRDGKVGTEPPRKGKKSKKDVKPAAEAPKKAKKKPGKPGKPGKDVQESRAKDAKGGKPKGKKAVKSR